MKAIKTVVFIMGLIMFTSCEQATIPTKDYYIPTVIEYCTPTVENATPQNCDNLPKIMQDTPASWRK